MALVAIAAYLGLGALVSPRPPGPLDLAAAGLLGHGLPFAFLAYQSGLFRTYAAVSLLAIGVAIVLPRWRGRVAFAIAALLVSWVISDFFKDVFARARPADWDLVRETSFSYSSGHATLTLATYGLWAFFLWRSELPLRVRAAAAGCLGAWCLVVGWSRLAMGAHYLTDVVGGWLLGFGILAALGALVEVFRDVRVTARAASDPPT